MDDLRKAHVCWFSRNRNFALSFLVAEVSYFPSGHEVHHRGDQGISRGFAVVLAIDTETLGAEVLGEGAAQIPEGVFGARNCSGTFCKTAA
jgi:hypothetical protein